MGEYNVNIDLDCCDAQNNTFRKETCQHFDFS